MTDSTLRPHVKAGDTKANSYLFSLGSSRKQNYMTLEELEWLAENGQFIREVLASSRDQVRDAVERREASEDKKLKKEISNAHLSAIQTAQFQKLFQDMMRQMAMPK